VPKVKGGANASPRRVGRGATARDRRLARLLHDLESICFHEGFLHLTVNNIAKRLHCSKSTLYQLAPTQRELFDLVAKRFLKGIQVRGRFAAEQAGDWNTALRALLGAAVDATRDVDYAFLRDLRQLPSTRRLVIEHQRRRVTDVERLLVAGTRDGAFCDLNPRLTAELMLAALRRLVEPNVIPSAGLSVADAIDVADRLFEYGLLPRRKTNGAPRRGMRPKLNEVWPDP
jgi:AcrR family transcriptional regulator